MVDSGGPKEPCISGVEILNRRDKCGLVQPVEKHWESMLRHVTQKKINNGDSGTAVGRLQCSRMDVVTMHYHSVKNLPLPLCVADFLQNSLTGFPRLIESPGK